jgi:DNA helicase-2/ATP-dependent DNA helicase PcrA
MTATIFKPSKYQAAIFDFATDGRGSAVVDAAPGSGKTTTCVQTSTLLHTNRVLFVAFNRHIAEELKNRLPKHIKAQTIHSLGLSALKRRFPKTEIDDRKYSKLIRQFLINDGIRGEEYERTRNNIADLLRLTQLTLTNPESEADLLSLAEHFDLDLKGWEYTWRTIAPLLDEGRKMAYVGIDFNDMVWLPNTLDLYPSQYDFLIADECQDLNKAQLELVLKAHSAGARGLYVGDKRQAIFSFTGADSRSIDNIISRTNALTLPLSICYRCPTSHIELANQVWPGVEPRPNAPKGTVEHIDERDIVTKARKGDLVICRCNAPLVSICFALIRSGIPARIRGRDIGRNLVAIIKQVAEIATFRWANFIEHLKQWEREQIQAKMKLEDAELAIQGVRDRTDTILAIYQYSRPENLLALEQAIAGLFTDERASVWLSTVHKAKGLEAERVFILRPELMPHPAAKKLWEVESEKNVKFVALTRAKRELYFAYGDGRDVEEMQPSEATPDQLEHHDEFDVGDVYF